MDGAVSVAGVADLKICYLLDRAGYIYKTHNTHVFAKVYTGEGGAGANFDGGEGDET